MKHAGEYKHILFEHQEQHLDDGWIMIGPGPHLGGWPSVIAFRPVNGRRMKKEREATVGIPED